MSGGASSPIDVRQLLTIDVGSELRKLSSSQLQGAWQLPAELVRRAIRAGARHVEVTLSRQVVVADDGAGIHPALLEQVAILLDSRRPTEERHRALTNLEQAGELALLALLGVEPLPELSIATRFENRLLTLHLRQGSPAVIRAEGALAAPGTRIVLRAPGFDRRQAAQWLHSVARLCPATVLIDGTKVRSGFSDSLIESPLTGPLRGRVALLPEGDSAHAHLLADGLVTAQVTIPGAPSFEAAVELGSPAGDLSPSRLRDALVPLIPALVDQAVSLLARAAPGGAAGPEPRRARLARLVLQSIRRNLRAAELRRLPLFRTVSAAGPSLLDLAQLRASATAGDPQDSPVLLALSPDQRVDRYALGSEPVLLADEAERSLLADVLGVRFRPPSLRASSHSVTAVARGVARSAGRWLMRAADLVRHPLRPPTLADESLTTDERAFLQALRRHLAEQPIHHSAAVVMCSGRGPLRRQGRRRGALVWLLPRDNPLVLASRNAWSEDPRWLRIVTIALHGTLSPEH